MKINTLAIHRFGRFEDKKIDFPQTPIVMIYGENETGKSTMMAFILSQLFGFPSKKVLEKWKGKNRSDAFGGSLTFTADDGKSYRVERNLFDQEEMRFVTATGGAADLHALLRGINRVLYQNVFCFDLDGLRNIDKKNPSDMNDLLLGAGMIGSGELGSLEQRLEKNCAELFKKSGKKPQINRLFTELSACSADLKEWEKKLDSYQELQQKIRDNQKQLEEREAQKKSIQHEFQWWTAFSAARPLILTYQALNHEHEHLEQDLPFPQNGKEHYEDTRKRLIALNNDLAESDEQIGQLDESRRLIHANEQWRELEGSLQRLFHDAVTDVQNQKERQRIDEECRKQQADLKRLCDLLGSIWSPERIRQASSELTLRHQLKEKINCWKKNLDEQRDGVRDLESISERAKNLESRLKDCAFKRMATGGKRRHDAPSARPVRFQALTILTGCVTLLLTILSAVVITPLAGVPVFLFGVGMCASLYFAAAHIGGNSKGVVHARSEDGRIAAEQTLLEDQLRAVRADERRLNERQEACARAGRDLEEEIRIWLGEQGYPIDDLNGAEEKVRLVNGAQEICRKLDTFFDRQQALGKAHEKFKHETRKLAAKLGIQDGDADYLEQRYRQEVEEIRRREDLDKQRLIYQKQRERIVNRIELIKHEQASLLEEANVANESQFFIAADRDERRRVLKKQMETCRMQLLELTGSEKQVQEYVAYLDSHQWENLSEQEFKDRISVVELKLTELRDQLASDRANSASLEKNDSYRDTLDRYHALLNDAGIKAKDWAVFQTALWAIREAKEQYREQRLPRVLNDASIYFEMMTDGRYESIQLDDDGFSAIDSAGQRIHALGLSRGTAEQLYLSLRLALMKVFSGYETLPMIIDDGFVNFDYSRSKKVYELLEKVAENRQVIILTCHDNDFQRDHPEAVLRLHADDRTSASHS
ncbi:AAA family ATPase [Sporolactobacillus sp. STCC-11]|uniref:ATP-binding protein n=1 Tax=Sporolactobacillus caesalpiniae TaxID=3230362 RepID=UPI0033987E7F